MTQFLDVIQGDVLATLRQLDSESVDSILSDFPYGLSHEPDPAEMLRHWIAEELREHSISVFRSRGISDAGARQLAEQLYPATAYEHGGRGFMGKRWDSFVPGPEVARELLRVLKPGGHALIFGGTRTYDLTVLALRLGGFEIRDQLDWLYGSGFPKSLDVSKAIDNAAGAERAAIGTKVYGDGHVQNSSESIGFGGCDPAADRRTITAPATPEAAAWDGWGTALKPAHEPIALVRKPLAGTVAANVLRYGTGAINVDACRVGDEDMSAQWDREWNDNSGELGARYPQSGRERGKQVAPGRWPANVLLDPDAAAILDAQAGVLRNGGQNATSRAGDSGGASRFFYCAKASRGEREKYLADVGAPVRSGGQATDRADGSDGLKSPRAGAGRGGGRRNDHPTVKPIELLRYLARLITPEGGTVLVPYAGSGSEVIGCGLEGYSAIGIEIDPGHVAKAWARIGGWCSLPHLTERARAWYANERKAAA